MQTTRRFWLTIATVATTAILAVLLRLPLLFGVPVGLSGWLVARQAAFTSTVQAINAQTDVTYTVTPNPVLVDETVELTVSVDRTTSPTPASRLKLRTVPGIDITSESETALPVGESTTVLNASATVTVAGRYTLPPPNVSLEDPAGLFTETIPLGEPTTVTVTPRVPRDIHVGEGGERIGIAIGDHDAEQGSAGFEPGELQEYTPGDPANRIDWKATARLQDPYIRDFEAESSRQTILLVDNRATMQTGREGETKLEYAREVAMWLLEYANSVTDPFATTIVHDDDTWRSGPPTTADTDYRRIRRHLQDLSPQPQRVSSSKTWSVTASTAQDRSRDLNGDDQFERTLAPYFTDVTTYYQRVADTPLFEMARRETASADGGAWLAIITDDKNREELLETVRAVATETTSVAVFVLPSVLFSPTGLTDVPAAYEDYLDFEDFRQRLAAIPHTRAYEVGPQDRLDTVLQASQQQRRDLQ
jgi:uncharacterized protein (DUF58 family)